MGYAHKAFKYAGLIKMAKLKDRFISIRKTFTKLLKDTPPNALIFFSREKISSLGFFWEGSALTP
jgi:hypothetical protein